jgi:signal transduction histidine kinase
MAHTSPRVLASRTERNIALARVVLVVTSWIAAWSVPGQAGIYFDPQTLHAAYAVYAVAVALLVWLRPPRWYTPTVSHASDIALAVVFQSLTMGGATSPFFSYMIFALFCGAMRWGWRGTLWTSVVITTLYVGFGVLGHYGIPVRQQFDATRFMNRTFYLGVVALLLLLMGEHDIRIRRQIERLTRWPIAASGDQRAVLASLLEHAAGILGAHRAVVAWEDGDEPWLHIAAWTPAGVAVTRHRSGSIEPLVPTVLAAATVLSPSATGTAHTVYTDGTDTRTTWHGQAVHRVVGDQLDGVGLISAPLALDRVSGRVFFSDLNAVTAELVALTAIVAREIATSLAHLSIAEQLRNLAASEQRLRVARDLHDGVLQSMTGIRLELQHVAASLEASPAAEHRCRLVAIERTLALEQRELRLFIDRLRPQATIAVENSLTKNLEALRARVGLQWNVPLAIRVSPNVGTVPEAIAQAIPPMVHEAIINALKHGAPSRVWVDVGVEQDVLRVVVNDDGHGFPFRGRFGHAALEASHLGPASLRERAASLGGELTIESEGAGSRVEIALPIITAGVA